MYPTPLNEASYVKQTMKEDDTIYYVYEFGENNCAASAEMNIKEGNAELTNCATLPEYRETWVYESLLIKLEEELQKNRFSVLIQLLDRFLSRNECSLSSVRLYVYRKIGEQLLHFDKLEEYEYMGKKICSK